jgi:hypothetical protein
MKFANRYKAAQLAGCPCEPLYDFEPPPQPQHTISTGRSPAADPVSSLTAASIGRGIYVAPQLRGLGETFDTPAKKAALGVLLFGGAAYAVARYTKPGKKLGKPMPAALMGAALGAAIGPLIY